MSKDSTNYNKKNQIAPYDPHGLKIGRKEKILDEDTYIQVSFPEKPVKYHECMAEAY